MRAFCTERFAIWRCGKCRSIHARDEVDLDRYYSDYPFHKLVFDWRAKAVYRKILQRLKRAGMTKDSKILDHGCGSGHVVGFLKDRGYGGAVGYDSYSDEFNDASVLEDRYDVVLSQDVLEHVEDPRELLASYGRWAAPGGKIVIGTPNAAAMDLSRPEDFVHSLHQPYHTHILSIYALVQIGTELGWTLERLYHTNYTNTLVPCLNVRFGLHYGKYFDNNVDLAFDGFLLSPKLFLPSSLFFAFFGYFLSPPTDIMAVFRTAA